MDESLHELEAELKALRPRDPSPRLGAQIARELAQDAPAAADQPRYTTATNLGSWKWLGWPTVAAAAAALAVFAAVGFQMLTRHAEAPGTRPAAPAFASNDSATPATSDLYRPVSVASVLYDLQDEGAVTLTDEQPARQARYRYVDTYTWKNPANNASVKWSVPRDEVRVMPARFN